MFLEHKIRIKKNVILQKQIFKIINAHFSRLNFYI